MGPVFKAYLGIVLTVWLIIGVAIIVMVATVGLHGKDIAKSIKDNIANSIPKDSSSSNDSGSSNQQSTAHQ